jgi:hypothetical protein
LALFGGGAETAGAENGDDGPELTLGAFVGATGEGLPFPATVLEAVGAGAFGAEVGSFAVVTLLDGEGVTADAAPWFCR